ncbi:hypothetical protein GQ43DRAFT_7928 [Delitschia confertaspora ATCC 74209]|uniref:Uncharacterized protein n=1 Tax=Delitschia confertaspora ATCC 74209 TaxID=1513339 RepID=A0A9P4MZR7_9PLEO|nr:hypothetical protein GQ43DRAFT_7928 [Delitschia confertaspora ATCC 74209]
MRNLGLNTCLHLCIGIYNSIMADKNIRGLVPFTPLLFLALLSLYSSTIAQTCNSFQILWPEFTLVAISSLVKL